MRQPAPRGVAFGNPTCDTPHPFSPGFAATIAVQFVGWAGLLVLAGAPRPRRNGRAPPLVVPGAAGPLAVAYPRPDSGLRHPGEALIDAVPGRPPDAGINRRHCGLRLGLMLGLLA